MSEFAEVVLPLPLDRPFTYRVPPALRPQVRPGVRVLVPFGPRTLSGFVVALKDRADFPRIRDLRQATDEVLADGRTLELTRWVARRYACSWGEALQAAIPAGARVKDPGRTLRFVEAGSGETPRGEKQKAAFAYARTLTEPMPRRDFERKAGVSASTVAALIRSGHLKESRVRPDADLLDGALNEAPKEIRLTPDQERALALVAQGPGVVLLHGITGSGKTEVYLRAIERSLAEGRQAIVLVPEIALTPQTLSRFRARFPRVAVLHSVLTGADRAAQWRAIRDGRVDVVVGARSAVFAPVPRLGVLVLDEEHETAYKQEGDPRYHARDVAVHRARTEGAVAILGSATPSLESIHRARAGDYRLASLPVRVEGRELPEIEVVDMNAEEAETKRRPILSRRLDALLRQAAERGEQSILFLNRRGFLTHTSCRRCGWFFRCGQCDVAMTYHRETDRALCHYCNASGPLPELCPDCGTGPLQRYGTGTERIESEIRAAFPGFAVSRMDSDSMKTRGDYRRSLQALWEGDTDILVGTQMIAKGLDVPDVTLVGVISGDTAFHVPDFRAAEKTFQLITQVAGRTGRGAKGGRVVVQTHFPSHPALKAAATYDFEGFVQAELDLRRDLGYPPFASLVRLLIGGVDRKKVAEAGADLGTRLAAAFPEPRAKVLGPAEPPVAKLKGRWRLHFLMKCPDLEAVLDDLRGLVQSWKPGAGLALVVDVDPASLL
jgi:primosomal protein N' (replication factor Y)